MDFEKTYELSGKALKVSNMIHEISSGDVYSLEIGCYSIVVSPESTSADVDFSNELQRALENYITGLQKSLKHETRHNS